MIIIWLFWSASIIGIETGDGYSTIVTSQYLLNLNKEYGFQRGPLLAIYLLPAEWISNFLNLHPLDVRVHHIFTALLHSLYLVFSWLLLKRYYRESDWVVATAFLATIPSFIYFSYAPFISSDIIPGLILLSMTLLIARYEREPDWLIWIYLIILGFLTVTIKQTYALFWVSILITGWFFYSKKINLHLFLAASVSGILSYLAYAWFLQGAISSDTLWWIAPIKQITFINNLYTKQHADISELFVWWLYLRNFYNFGILTAILLLPAVLYALFYNKTKDKTLQIMALIWLINIIFMQLISFKEVRYLAYLAPISAFLLVPFIRLLYKTKYNYALLTLVLASFSFDLSRNINEALRVNQEFYRGMVQNYFKPLDNLYASASFYNIKKPQVIAINHTGFTPHIFSPLNGDRYHRTFHIPNHALSTLYNFLNLNYSYYTIKNIDDINVSYELFSEGDIFLFSNQNPAREPPWDTENMSSLKDSYAQVITIAEKIVMTKNKNTYHASSIENNPGPLLIMNDKNHKFRVTLSSDTFDSKELEVLLGKSTLMLDTIELMGFRISRYCNKDGCYDMQDNGKKMH